MEIKGVLYNPRLLSSCLFFIDTSYSTIETPLLTSLEMLPRSLHSDISAALHAETLAMARMQDGCTHSPGPRNTLSGKISEHTTDSSLSTTPGCFWKETNVHRKTTSTQISSWSWVRMKPNLVTKQSELGSEMWTTSSCSARIRHVLWV